MRKYFITGRQILWASFLFKGNLFRALMRSFTFQFLFFIDNLLAVVLRRSKRLAWNWFYLAVIFLKIVNIIFKIIYLLAKNIFLILNFLLNFLLWSLYLRLNKFLWNNFTLFVFIFSVRFLWLCLIFTAIIGIIVNMMLLKYSKALKSFVEFSININFLVVKFNLVNLYNF